MNRRGFLAGLTGLLVAPSIVRAATPMPVSAPAVEVLEVTGTTTITAGLGGYLAPEWVRSAIIEITNKGARNVILKGFYPGDIVVPSGQTRTFKPDWMAPPPWGREGFGR